MYDKKIAVHEAVEATKAIYVQKVATEVKKAQEESISLLNSALADIKKKDNEIKNINNELTRISSELHKRPSRENNSRSPGSGKTCTGAELSREDGEFLAREAARADKILKERDYYYEQYKRARESLAALKKSNG